MQTFHLYTIGVNQLIVAHLSTTLVRAVQPDVQQ